MSDISKKSFLQSAQARVFLAIGLVVVAVGVVGFLIHLHNSTELNAAGASVSGAPGLASVPGAGNPSDAYVKAQNEANQMGEAQARKDATAYVPTITRAGFVGNPDEFSQAPQSSSSEAQGNNKNCAINKVVLTYKADPENCTQTKLVAARQSGVTAEELMCQGCACPVLREAGYNAGDLKQVGMTAAQLKTCGFTLQDLVSAGFTPADLKDAGYSAAALKAAGFTAGELRSAGFSAADLKGVGYSAAQLRDAGFSAGELKAAGLSNAALAAAGYASSEITAAQTGEAAACSAQNIAKAHAAGVSATTLKAEGCGIAALKAAGYTAQALAAAGFTDTDLASASFTPEEIVGAKAAIATLCSPQKLAEARAKGTSAIALKNEGCGLAALKAAGFSAAQLKAAGFSASVLKSAGFSDAGLSDAGFSPADIRQADVDSKTCSVEKLKQEHAAGMSATALRDQGCGLDALKAAGFSAHALRAAGFSASELKAAGFSAKALRDAGFSAAQLKAAGYSPAQLKDGGFSASDLKDAGFSAATLKDTGYAAADLQGAGFTASQLRNAGVSPTDLKAAGFSPAQLKDAGFSAGQLVAAGFSAKDLARGGFSVGQLYAAGVGASALKEAGFGAADLKAAGFTTGALARAGYATTDVAGPQKAESTPSTSSDATVAASPTDALGGALTTEASATALPSINQDASEARLAKIEKQQQADMSAQQQRDQMQRSMGMMMSQAGKFMAGWSNVSQQALVKSAEVDSSKSSRNAVSDLIGGSLAGNANGGAGNAPGTNSGGPIIKAGSVLFGVLETSVDSDESTPIMARIVSGPLTGSKLLGSFTRQNDKLLIQFTALNNPNYPRSISINAVAIDPDTARTALSGQVNYHYMLRYGSLFASSFLQGVAEGVVNAGTSSQCLFGSTGCTVSQSPLDTVQQLEMGLGKVGQAYSQHMSKDFTMPPTIRISAGTGFGLLLMGDLDMPAPGAPMAPMVVTPAPAVPQEAPSAPQAPQQTSQASQASQTSQASAGARSL